MAPVALADLADPVALEVLVAPEVLEVLGPSAGSSSRGFGLPGGSGGIPTAITLIVLVGPDQQERLAFARAFADLEVSICPQAP